MNTAPSTLGTARAIQLQFRLLWLSRRPFGFLAGLVALQLLLGEFETLRLRLFADGMVSILLVGPIWAFVVWNEETPSRRGYFWSQPVTRASQSVARVLAGLAWLWLIILAVLPVGLLIAARDGQLGMLSGVSLAGWATHLVAPTIIYVALSSLTVAVERPFWWLMGLLVFFFVALLYGVIPSGRPSEYDLGYTLFAPWMETMSLTGAPPLIERLDPIWWIAWPLWVAAFSLLLCLAARVHPDWLDRLKLRMPRGPRGQAGTQS